MPWIPAVIAAAGSIAGGALGSKTKSQSLQTAEEQKARTHLLKLMGGGAPNIPVAPTKEADWTTSEYDKMLQSFTSSPSASNDYLKQLLGESNDVTQTDYGKALSRMYDVSNASEVNRASRGIKLQGGSNSTTGRNMLGQLVGDLSAKKMSAMIPMMEAQQSRKMQAAMALNDDTPMLQRLNLLSQGTASSYLQNLAKQAQYQKQYTEQMWPYEQGSKYASMILGNPAEQLVTKTPNFFSQAAQPMADMYSAISNANADAKAKADAQVAANLAAAKANPAFV